MTTDEMEHGGLGVSCWMISAENQISLLKSDGVKTAE